jgi:hypothetical protein
MSEAIDAQVPDEERPRDANPDEASLRLRAGLKTCRAMVANYRDMIASDGDGLSGAGGLLEPSDEPGSEMEDFLPETEAAPD